MEELKVSVIVPNYNHAQYIEERLQSILNQTYRNFEIIILDDKSTDESIGIINKYAVYPNVSHVVVNKENSGSPFKQWHKGFELAQGDLIWIAESDDTCDASFLQLVVSSFEKDPKCVLSFCKSVRIDGEGKCRGWFAQQEGVNSFFMVNKEFMRKYLSKYNIVINASSAVFKKTALLNVDKAYMDYRGCGDWAFWAEVSKSGTVAYTDKELNFYRVYGQNTTSTLAKKGVGVKEICKIYDYFFLKGYINRLVCFRRKLSLLLGVKYRSNFSKDEIREFETECHYNFIYKTAAVILHSLGR